jgi:GGDEF domain-containing protein
VAFERWRPSGDDIVTRLKADGATNPGSNTLARFGGDEFVVLLDDIREPSRGRVAERVQTVAVQPLVVTSQEVFASPGIGLAVCSPDHRSGDGPPRCRLAMHRPGRGRQLLRRV